MAATVLVSSFDLDIEPDQDSASYDSASSDDDLASCRSYFSRAPSVTSLALCDSDSDDGAPLPPPTSSGRMGRCLAASHSCRAPGIDPHGQTWAAAAPAASQTPTPLWCRCLGRP